MKPCPHCGEETHSQPIDAMSASSLRQILQRDRLMPFAEACAMVGACKRTVVKWRAERGFPQPVVMNGLHLYSELEIQTWIAEQKARRDATLSRL